MEMSVSAVSTTYVAATASMVAMAHGVDSTVAIGAFTGATMFIISNDASRKLEKLGLFVVSFLGGILCAGWVERSVSAALPATMSMNPGMAALISSACVVRALQYIMKLNIPENWLTSWQKRK